MRTLHMQPVRDRWRDLLTISSSMNAPMYLMVSSLPCRYSVLRVLTIVGRMRPHDRDPSKTLTGNMPRRSREYVVPVQVGSVLACRDVLCLDDHVNFSGGAYPSYFICCSMARAHDVMAIQFQLHHKRGRSSREEEDTTVSFRSGGISGTRVLTSFLPSRLGF